MGATHSSSIYISLFSICSTPKCAQDLKEYMGKIELEMYRFRQEMKATKKEVLDAIENSNQNMHQALQRVKKEMMKAFKDKFEKMERLMDEKLQELSDAAEGHHVEQMEATNNINKQLLPAPPQGFLVSLTGNTALSTQDWIIRLVSIFLVALMCYNYVGVEVMDRIVNPFRSIQTS